MTFTKANPAPLESPPSSWPAAITGLITVPQSLPIAAFSVRTIPVQVSTSISTKTVTYAGGIMCRDCTAAIVGNVISNNHTNGRGGGLFY